VFWLQKIQQNLEWALRFECAFYAHMATCPRTGPDYMGEKRGWKYQRRNQKSGTWWLMNEFSNDRSVARFLFFLCLPTNSGWRLRSETVGHTFHYWPRQRQCGASQRVGLLQFLSEAHVGRRAESAPVIIQTAGSYLNSTCICFRYL